MANSADVDASEVLRNFNEFIKKSLPENLRGGMEKACLVVERTAKKKCPDNTGTLRASITHTVEVKGADIEGYIGSPLEHAVYVHQGTGIYAAEGNGRKDVPWYFPVNDGGKLNAKYGMQIVEIQGKEFYKTSGIRPRPFITEAIEENRDKIIQCFSEVMGK